MKIVCISDTHGNHESVNVPDGDVLVMAGDVTMNRGRESLKEFLVWLEEQPHQFKLLIAGNHDRIYEERPTIALDYTKRFAPSVIYLQDSGFILKDIKGSDNIKFWGSPVTPRFFDWAFNRDRGEAIRKHWDLIPNDTDVLITHGPPFSHLDLSNNWNDATGRKFDDCLGCRDLYEAVMRVQPRLHVFGHIHGSGGRTKDLVHDNGWKTRFVNASIMDEAYIPNHNPVVVDFYSI